MKLLTILLTLLTLTTYAQTKIYVPGGVTSGVENNTSNDNVGIGISTPTVKLHVNGDIRGRNTITVENNGSYRVALNGMADGYVTGRNDAGQNMFFINSNGNSYLNGGNVGIGTPSPSATLHVIGNLKATAQINGAEYVSVDKNGGYRVAMNGQGDGYIAGRNDQLEKKFQISSNGNSYLAGGNVGIGTTTPDALLTVKGQIHSQEVKVDLNGAVAPDYVFKESYQLKSLEEVKHYVDDHSHLPNIPSAKEMEENGIELKEMNLKLLEKVEELTLYLIQQNEINKAQAEEIEALQRKLEEVVKQK